MPARVADSSVIGAIAFKEDQAEQAESLLEGPAPAFNLPKEGTRR